MVLVCMCFLIQFKRIMGVPGFYSWLTKRYPMIKHMISKQSLPQIDYLYLDMNGIIYKCVRDDSIIFKAQLMPKQLEQIWIEVFNYINSIVDLLKPTKTIVLALDGVAPRCKMNNQRSRRFRSAQDYKQYLKQFYGYTDLADSQENFKNNSISPGTRFMQQLNEMIHFFLLKKIEEDQHWKNLSIIFTGSDTPGEGEHKIMEFIRANRHSFLPDDTHCLYGADADLIMLGLTLPVKNACIIREEYVHASQKVQIMSSRKEKEVRFELIYLSILRECFDLEYSELRSQMRIEYSLEAITRDFVFLFFFIGNDFLPRIYAYNIREKSIEKLIQGFKNFLKVTESYVAGQEQLCLPALLLLMSQVGKFQAQFFADKHMQFQKMLNRQRVGFEDELQLLFVSKIKCEEQTLLGLKQMYANLDGSGRIQFYSSYFNLDPQQNPNEFINILAYYVYGLKFVYQYYFQNLSSWSWYYPYYFAPLLTDLQFYLSYMLNSGQKLVDFDLGAPFQPFKQLLCILPKESADLLPQNFQSYIQDPNSILRNPVDFYPDTVETVAYGSIRGHEAVLLIPFLDQSIICQAYDQQIGRTAPEDLSCNICRESRLYEYLLDGEATQVKSPFPSISNFSSRTNVRNVDLKKQFPWRSQHNHPPVSAGEESLLKMPTLYMRPFTLRAIKREQERFQVELLQEPAKEYFKLGETVFFGYPQEHSGRIEAILTKNKFIYVDSESFQLKNYELFLRNTAFESPNQVRSSPAKLFDYLRGNLSSVMNGREPYLNFLNLTSTQVFLFIVDTRSFTRNLQGDFVRLFRDNFRQSFSVVPAAIADKKKIYQNTLTNIHFASLEQQFLMNEQVLLTHPDAKLCGARGRVVGYAKEQRKVKVQLIQEPKYNSSKLGDIVKMLSTKADIFFSLRFAAEILRMPFDQLQTMLGTINVVTPKESKLPPSIDIGLNLMSRKEYKIVPNLVRVNFRYDSQKKKQNPFKYLQLSYRALEIALEYKQLFPQIFSYMEKRHRRLVDRARQNSGRIQWEEPIMADAIYPVDTAKSLMKVYKWLVEKEETHMPASSLYSKQVQQKRIARLKEQFLSQRTERQKGKKRAKKYVQARIELIDPNFLFSERLSQLGSLYLKKRPANHQIGDIVICVSPQFFGHYGAIVGIDDNKYQVLFDEPSFGKNDLGGLCDNLWGYKFDFKDLLNLEIWPNLFSERHLHAAHHEKMGWVDSAQEFFPLYQSKPFQDFEDIRIFTEKPQNRKFFSAQFLQTIETVQKGLKQVQVDESYTVVDNKKEEHRYKYQKKVLYIEKQQIQEAVKVSQYLQEHPENAPIAVVQNVEEPIPPELIPKEVQKEIIENKVQAGEKAEQIGEEQDGADILG